MNRCALFESFFDHHFRLSRDQIHATTPTLEMSKTLALFRDPVWCILPWLTGRIWLFVQYWSRDEPQTILGTVSCGKSDVKTNCGAAAATQWSIVLGNSVLQVDGKNIHVRSVFSQHTNNVLLFVFYWCLIVSRCVYLLFDWLFQWCLFVLLLVYWFWLVFHWLLLVAIGFPWVLIGCFIGF